MTKTPTEEAFAHIAALLAAAREESRPAPRLSPVGREEVARIIDPEGWSYADEERRDFPADPPERICGTPRLKRSLAKADAILALISVIYRPTDMQGLCEMANAYLDSIDPQPKCPICKDTGREPNGDECEYCAAACNAPRVT